MVIKGSTGRVTNDGIAPGTQRDALPASASNGGGAAQTPGRSLQAARARGIPDERGVLHRGGRP